MRDLVKMRISHCAFLVFFIIDNKLFYVHSNDYENSRYEKFIGN